MTNRIVAAICAPLLLLSASIFAAERLDVSGDWQLTVQTAADSMKPSLKLEQDGKEITGSYQDEFGATEVSGTLEGEQITLEVPTKIPGEKIVLTLTGHVDSTSMKGRWKFGDLGEGSFTGRKL